MLKATSSDIRSLTSWKKCRDLHDQQQQHERGLRERREGAEEVVVRRVGRHPGNQCSSSERAVQAGGSNRLVATNTLAPDDRRRRHEGEVARWQVEKAKNAIGKPVARRAQTRTRACRSQTVHTIKVCLVVVSSASTTRRIFLVVMISAGTSRWHCFSTMSSIIQTTRSGRTQIMWLCASPFERDQLHENDTEQTQ